MHFLKRCFWKANKALIDSGRNEFTPCGNSLVLAPPSYKPATSFLFLDNWPFAGPRPDV